MSTRHRFGALLLAVLPLGAIDAAWGAARGESVTGNPSGADEFGSVSGTFVSHERLKTRGPTSQRHVVLYLTGGKDAEHAPPSEPVVVEQRKLQFVPHVLPVLAGTKVDFKNLDEVVHNTYSSDECCSMDVDMEAGASNVHTFETPGVASVVCRLHPDMSLFVVVRENPWFTGIELEKQSVEGERQYRADFRIEGVPAGDYVLTFWNKKLAPVEVPVTIRPGEETTADVSIAG